ncbi:MAG: rRNA maturation RNase YbeY [Bacteroidota bacterium]|nr:rRNA maturation RNase YbeY [Bacteroidota bacterium]
MLAKAKPQFHFLVDPFELQTRKISNWIQKTILHYQKPAGEIQIIFCNDDYLFEMNQKYLQHDYYTDIITFPNSDSKISGDLYISVDRVLDNARQLTIDFEIELLRVIIHGIFHLLDFKDNTAIEKKQMRQLEDDAIKLYKEEFLAELHYYDRVYDVVRMIPEGKVSTFGIISDYLALGSAKMVGWALNQLKGNQTDIPAHRVVNAKGELSGRLHFSLDHPMEKRLTKEGIKIKDSKITDLNSYLWKPE